MANKKPKISEVDLCRSFIAWAKEQGWTAYAETGGYDIVLVNAEGVQIGVQAKLRFNATLLRQIIPVCYRFGEHGPDYRAILLPDVDNDIRDVAKFCGVVCFHRAAWGDAFVPQLDFDGWHCWECESRIQLPDYVPDVAAGASAPKQLSRWKVGALRISALLEIQGFVERKDFNRFGVDPRRWTVMDWLTYNRAEKRYVAGKSPMKFPGQHPTVYQQILGELREAAR